MSDFCDFYIEILYFFWSSRNCISLLSFLIDFLNNSALQIRFHYTYIYIVNHLIFIHLTAAFGGCFMQAHPGSSQVTGDHSNACTSGNFYEENLVKRAEGGSYCANPSSFSIFRVAVKDEQNAFEVQDGADSRDAVTKNDMARENKVAEKRCRVRKGKNNSDEDATVNMQHDRFAASTLKAHAVSGMKGKSIGDTGAQYQARHAPILPDGLKDKVDEKSDRKRSLALHLAVYPRALSTPKQQQESILKHWGAKIKEIEEVIASFSPLPYYLQF
jgi:hypothetical protein